MLSPALAAAAPGPTEPGGPIPEAPKPGDANITGKWLSENPMVTFKTIEGKAPPLNAKGKTLYAKRLKDKASDPDNRCVPQGIPRILYTSHPFLILQYQNRVDFIFEVNHTFRLTHLGVPLPSDPDPLWLGNSSSHVEGKTVVIDSVGHNADTWLDYSGLPHGEKLKLQERYTLSDDGQELNGTVRVDDPEFYTAPWTTAFKLRKQPDFTLKQLSCLDDHQM
jgi:hypothetical protein